MLIYRQQMWQNILLHWVILPLIFRKHHYAQFRAVLWLAYRQILEMKNGDVFHPHMAHKMLCLLSHNSQVHLLVVLLLASVNSSFQDDQNVNAKSPPLCHHLGI